MSYTFKIELREWYYDYSDGGERANFLESFSYVQPFYKTYTIKDAKNYVKDQRVNDPICTCFLEIRKTTENNTITLCNYSDSTFLNDTIFRKNELMTICIKKGRICTCGKYEQIIVNSNLKKNHDEEIKRWEKKEKENKEYFERMIRDQKEDHRRELNRLQSSFDQLNQRYYENQQKIEDQKNSYERKLDQLNNVIQEQNKENNAIKEQMNLERQENYEKFKMIQKTIDEKDLQIKQNSEQLLAYENQKKKKIKDEKDAENFFVNNIYLIYNDYYKKNKEIIISEFIFEITKYFKNIVILEDKILISKISKNEKFSKNIKDIIEDKIFSLKEENMKYIISHFNILIIGNTGVGKSTLLNTVLKSELAKTGYGDSCTTGSPKYYESEKAKGIRIWDTRGIENGEYNLKKANEDIKNTIKSLIAAKDPDKFIHCLWYCINSNSNRFIKEEVNNLKECYYLYIEKLPIIVVLTQSYDTEDANEMIKHVKERIQNFDDSNNIKILKVLAKQKENKKKKNKKNGNNDNKKTFGISHLMNETFESSKNGIQSSCIDSLMEQGQLFLKDEFKDITDNLREKYLEHLNNNINNFNFAYFINFTKTFSKEIAENLLFNNKVLEKTISDINKIMDNKTNLIKDFFEKKFEEKLDNISNKLTEKLVDFVAQLDAKYKITYLSAKYHYNELKRLAKKNIITNLKPIIEYNIYKEISKKIFDKFSEELSAILLEVFQDLLIKNRGIKEIFKIKGKENAELCYKRIKKLLNYPKDDFVEENEDEEDED